MYESEKELLMKVCETTSAARQRALENELRANGVRYENWGEMALVIPSDAEEPIVLCAHYDVVPGSRGYNDNGMALVTVLKMLENPLPSNVEIVLTNCEERGALGARYYLEHTAKRIRGCINLDVCGCYDQVYLDPMNCHAARTLANCKQGSMPPSDAYPFANEGIPSVCFSSGPAETSFRSGIMRILSTMHNNLNDNKFDMLNFEMPDKVAAEVNNVIELMTA